MKFLENLSDKVLPTLFWLCIMLAFDSLSVSILTLISALVHEWGHILFASLVKRGDISLPRATLLGLKIDTGRLLSYKEEVMTALGGPLINLVIFVLTLPFFGGSEYIFTFGIINLFTALTNLLPIRGYDGERIIRSLLSEKFSPAAAEGVTGVLTLICSGLLSVISLLLIMLVGEGYWIFGFFFSVLLSEVLKKH